MTAYGMQKESGILCLVTYIIAGFSSYFVSYSSGTDYTDNATAAYHKLADGTITRIASTVSNSTLIYSIFQNAARSYNTGLEIVLSEDVVKWFSFNINLNGYRNRIDAFTVENKYPVANTFTADKQEIFSGNAKLNTIFHLPKNLQIQATFIYLAPDIIPQGKISQRFSLDLGIKTTIQKGKGELFLNATNLANTMVVKRQIQGKDFKYTATDYYETQVIRLGYSYKFQQWTPIQYYKNCFAFP